MNARMSSEELNCTAEFFKIIPTRKQSQTGGRAAVCFCLYCIVPVKASRNGRERLVSLKSGAIEFQKTPYCGRNESYASETIFL